MIISVNDNDLGNSTPVGGREMMDKGTQCCFDPLVLKSVGTQTDSITCENLVSERCSSTNTFPVAAEKWKICNDHTYAAQLPPHATSTICDESLHNIPLPTLSELEETGMSASCTEQDSDDDIGADQCADVDDKNHDKLKDEGMDKVYTPGINHQYDVWHISKWVVKKLTNKAKLKGCEELFPWIQSISNHIWWCAATCNRNVHLLREKWKSVLHHVVNKHKLSRETLFHKCCHKCIPLKLNKCWLNEPGSTADLALEEVVLNCKLLKDMVKLTEFCHTGLIEVYHSMMLNYRTTALKRKPNLLHWITIQTLGAKLHIYT